MRAISPKPESANRPAKKQSARSLKRLVVLELLSLVVIANAYAWIFYLSTHKPLYAALPVAEAATRTIRPHYLFSIYGLEEPVGVAATPDGERIYVAESGGERTVHAFDRDGKSLFAFAPPNSESYNRAPTYIALDNAGKVYVTDRLRHSVDTYDAGGNWKSAVQPVETKEWSPLGVRFNGDNLLLTDVTNGKHRVLGMNKDGRLTLQFGREGKKENDELWFPNSMIVDARGRAYISDSNNARVQVLDAAGNWLTTLRGFSLPRGMAIDDEQRLYVVDGIGQLVRVFDVAGDTPELLFEFGDYGPGNGEFNYPNDIAADKTGRLYIVDRASNRVQVWAY
ncbi:MAG: hypothetical protein HY868_21470 [Chloroflexi bacterium]|nr:hypothetical protein [Chloroflexota bacterium]